MNHSRGFLSMVLFCATMSLASCGGEDSAPGKSCPPEGCGKSDDNGNGIKVMLSNEASEPGGSLIVEISSTSEIPYSVECRQSEQEIDLKYPPSYLYWKKSPNGTQAPETTGLLAACPPDGTSRVIVGQGSQSWTIQAPSRGGRWILVVPLRAVETFGGLMGTASSWTLTVSGALSTEELRLAFAEAAKGALYLSESDYAPEFVAGDLTGGQPVSITTITKTLGSTMVDFFARGSSPLRLEEMAFELASPEESAAALTDLATIDPEDEELYQESAAAFGRIKALFDQNLTELRFLRAGPRDDDGSLAMDHGLYLLLFVGKTSDGKLAGFMVGSVET